MSGSNQHSIPQAILRQFKRKERGKVEQVYVFRRDRNYVEPVSKASAQKHFFSGPGDEEETPLDDLMTDFESGPFNADWQMLIRQSAGAIDSGVASRVVGHLIGRTHYFRGVIRSGAAGIGESVEQLLGNERSVGEMFDVDESSPGDRFQEMVADAINDTPMFAQLGLPGRAFVNLSHTIARENRKELTSTLAQAGTHIGGKFKSAAAKIARDAHRKGVRQSLTSQQFLQALGAMSWRIEQMNSETFILPDFVCLGVDEAGDVGSVFDIGGKDLAVLLMPLSPMRMLIGQLPGQDVLVDLAAFNVIAVPYCFDFFVSSFVGEDLKLISTEIGSRALSKIDEGLAQAVREIRGDAPRAAPQQTEAIAPQSKSKGGDLKLESDWLSSDDGHRLVDIVGRLREISAARFDLTRLVSIVAPADYAAKIAEMTGIAPSSAFDAGNDDWQRALNVVSPKEGSTIIVVHPRTVEALLSTDVQTMQVGAWAIMAQYAQIGSAALLDDVFHRSHPVGGSHDQLMITPALQCWVRYIIELNSGFGEHCQVRQTLIGALAGLRDQLNDLKQQWPTKEDAEQLLTSAIWYVGGLLAVAGEAAAGIIADVEPGELKKFYEDLAEIELARWFELMRSDLSEIWVPGDPYPDAEAFLVLNRHVERLLAIGGIFLWEDDAPEARYGILGWPIPREDPGPTS